MSDLPAFRLVRRAAAASPLVLDADQCEVVSHRQGGGPMRVLGAPGTGRTTVLVELAAARVERDGVAPGAVLLLAPSRRAAADLRDRVTRRLRRTVREPLARSVHSYAFGLLRQAAALAGDPPPRLLAAPEQDLILRDLLAGHRAGDGRSPDWPAQLRPALTTRGFRTELRDLFARSVERGVDPAGLAALGRAHQRADWVAAATLMAEYLDVTALRSPGAHDPAGLVQAAADLLESDPALLAAERDRWAVVLVDDYHDADPAAARLLGLVCGGGRDLVVAGDPDSAVLDFRGGDPRLLREFCSTFRTASGADAASHTLHTSWRRPRVLVELAARVTRRLPGPDDHRHLAVPDGPPGQLEVHVLRSETAEAAYLAHRLREARLRGGDAALGWSGMAVIARTATRLASLRRALVSAGVPVAVSSSQLTVREQPAVVPLLTALGVVLDPEKLDPETAVALLTSPLGGADAMALRRLRQALRQEERAGGGGRASDALLVEALGDPGWLATLDHRDARPGVRVATILAAGRAALARTAEGAVGDGVNAETVLWALWQASRLEESWRRTALAGGPAGARADRDLDAVVALFDAAARFVDRLPAAGPAAFLDYLLGQEVPGDTLAERAPSDEAVTLLTVHTASGQEWELVAVAGVYDGVWPDLRPRGSLLGSEQLVDIVSGRGSSP
ncbi:MAG TPA: ATP-dependent helicase, partial [Actinomycetes bacterium]|nr:ATP-dependent helicase [Actinomycetes bacterium]